MTLFSWNLLITFLFLRVLSLAVKRQLLCTSASQNPLVRRRWPILVRFCISQSFGSTEMTHTCALLHLSILWFDGDDPYLCASASLNPLVRRRWPILVRYCMSQSFGSTEMTHTCALLHVSILWFDGDDPYLCATACLNPLVRRRRPILARYCISQSFGSTEMTHTCALLHVSILWFDGDDPYLCATASLNPLVRRRWPILVRYCMSQSFGSTETTHTCALLHLSILWFDGDDPYLCATACLNPLVRRRWPILLRFCISQSFGSTEMTHTFALLHHLEMYIGSHRFLFHSQSSVSLDSQTVQIEIANNFCMVFDYVTVSHIIFRLQPSIHPCIGNQ